jgi:cell division protein FtsB
MKPDANLNTKRSWTARIAAQYAASRLFASRRRLGTIAAILVAMLLAYHVVAGNNGLTVYKEKMAEDKALAIEVRQLQQENQRLQRHVDHLATDPDAIEFEAHQRLRYMLPGQVTVLSDPPVQAGSQK